MKFPPIYFALIIVFTFGSATAKDYCPAMPQPKSEDDTWYIPESAFTKEAADKALKSLTAQIEVGVRGRDFLVDNDLKMIKGYLYRAYLAEHQKAFGTEDVELKNEFCTFLKTDAYISH